MGCFAWNSGDCGLADEAKSLKNRTFAHHYQQFHRVYPHFGRKSEESERSHGNPPIYLNSFDSNHKQLTMNKAELVDAMAEGAGISKADAKRALDAFIDATAGALSKGDRVSLVGFGSFSVSERAERKGRNPRTGDEITIAAKKVIKFKAGADLNDKM